MTWGIVRMPTPIDYLALLEIACETAAKTTQRFDLVPHYRNLADIVAKERLANGPLMTPNLDSVFRRLERWRIANGRDPVTGSKRKK